MNTQQTVSYSPALSLFTLVRALITFRTCLRCSFFLAWLAPDFIPASFQCHLRSSPVASVCSRVTVSCCFRSPWGHMTYLAHLLSFLPRIFPRPQSVSSFALFPRRRGALGLYQVLSKWLMNERFYPPGFRSYLDLNLNPPRCLDQRDVGSNLAPSH